MDSTDVRDWPPVSVIMPVIDEERHLNTAVTRVLDQDDAGASGVQAACRR